MTCATCMWLGFDISQVIFTLWQAFLTKPEVFLSSDLECDVFKNFIIAHLL